MADWEQLQGEPNQHYSWFLAYRNLGSTRSLDRAYAAFKRDETCERAPGNWADASVRHRWPERAAAWDVYVLSEAGAAVVVRFVDAMRELADQAIRGLRTHPPSSFSEALRAMEMLATLIPAESVAAAQQAAQLHQTPAIGGAIPPPAAPVVVVNMGMTEEDEL
jgi:hypothetical protein